MSDKDTARRDNLFAKLAQQGAKTEPVERAPLPSPAPIEPTPVKRAGRGEPGKRNDPRYCQANAYIPKDVRKEVDRALLDVDGLDYSSLVEQLLREWLESRSVST